LLLLWRDRRPWRRRRAGHGLFKAVNLIAQGKLVNVLAVGELLGELVEALGKSMAIGRGGRGQ
jgi:hypothetical protein